MRIENINEKSLGAASREELIFLQKHQFPQVYEKHFLGNRLEKSEWGMSRSGFLRKYALVFKEMASRGMRRKANFGLDEELFKRVMFGGLDVPKLGDIVLVENYMSVGGSFVKSPADASDIDVIIREREANRDEGIELKVGRLLAGETDKSPHFIYSLRGPHSSYIPVFDLVLRAREKTKRVDVRESKRVAKQGSEYFEQLDNWDEALMRDNFSVIRELAEGSVMDLGCGSGRLLKLLEQSGRQIMGVEKNEIAVGYCKKRGLSVVRADLDEDFLPFEPDSYDNVIGVHVLEHLEHPERAIDQAVRAAKKRVIFLVPLGERHDRTHKRKFENMDDFELLFKGAGPWIFKEDKVNNTALARLSLTRVSKKALSPFGFYDLPKPAMAGLTEAFSVEELKDWAKGRKLVAEPKLNGFRVVIAKAGDRFKIMTESRQDRSSRYPALSEDIKKIPDDFMLDCSMGIERGGHPLPRIKLMTLMADEPELQDNDVIVCTAFDLPFWKIDLHEQPFEERRKRLEAFYNKYLKGSEHFDISTSIKVSSLDALKRKFKQFAKLPQSEGVVVKDIKSKWSLTGSEPGWAKLKVEAEVKVQVIERQSVSGGRHIYLCGVLKGSSDYENTRESGGHELVVLGKTFSTKVSASPGDILTVGVEEIIPQDTKLVWLGPRVLDKDLDRSTPYMAAQIVDVARKANILQKAAFNCECLECGHTMESAWHCDEVRCPECGGPMRRLERPGPGAVRKIHKPGIYLVKPHGEKLIKGEKKAVVKPKRLPDDYVGKQIFLVEDKVVHGIIKLREEEPVDQEGFKELGDKHLITAEEARRWGFDKAKKLYVYSTEVVERYEPPYGYDPPAGVQTIIRDVHVEKQEGTIGEAGNVDFSEGDKGTGILQAHIMGIEEDKVEGLRKASGRLLVARADPAKLESELKKLVGEQAVHIDMRLRPSGKSYWEGGEIMVGNISGLSKLKKLAQQNKKLRFGWKVGRKQDGKQTQIVRGPLSWMEAGKRRVGIFEPGEVGATANKYAALVNIDSFNWELYSSDEHAKKFRFTDGKHLNGNFLFAYVPVDGRVWMMSRVADDDHEKEPKEKSSFMLRILKVDKKKQIVGGIVYQPDVKDSQGDYTNTEEIEKAMYRFMEKYGRDPKRIKVEHEGRTRYYPVLESFQPEQDIKKGGKTVPAGSWWLMIKVPDKDVWAEVEAGRLTGFSMGGRARESE